MFNHEFFGGTPDPDDRILTDADLNRCRYQGKGGCDALPAVWHDAQSQENKALSWFNAMAATLYFHKNNRIFPLRLLRKFCHVPIDAVGKTVYLITASIVKGREWPEAERGMLVVEGFLKDPRLFDRTFSALLIEQGTALATQS